MSKKNSLLKELFELFEEFLTDPKLIDAITNDRVSEFAELALKFEKKLTEKFGSFDKIPRASRRKSGELISKKDRIPALSIFLLDALRNSRDKRKTIESIFYILRLIGEFEDIPLDKIVTRGVYSVDLDIDFAYYFYRRFSTGLSKNSSYWNLKNHVAENILTLDMYHNPGIYLDDAMHLLRGAEGELGDVTTRVFSELGSRRFNTRADGVMITRIGHVERVVGETRYTLFGVKFSRAVDSKFYFRSSGIFSNIDQLVSFAIGDKVVDEFMPLFRQIRDNLDLSPEAKASEISEMIELIFQVRVSKAQSRDFSYYNYADDLSPSYVHSTMEVFLDKFNQRLKDGIIAEFTDSDFLARNPIEQEYMDMIMDGIETSANKHSREKAIFLDTPGLYKLH